MVTKQSQSDVFSFVIFVLFLYFANVCRFFYVTAEQVYVEK